MWRIDKDNYEEEERRLNDKIRKINMENADFLRTQTEQKQRGKKKTVMNKQEFLLNRPLLKEINAEKKKGASNIDSQS